MRAANLRAPGLAACVALALAAVPVRADLPPAYVPNLAWEIDVRMGEHWKSRQVTPAAAADEPTLFRRVTLDLIGRIPTRPEWEAFAASKGDAEERYRRGVRQQVDGPEFPLHFGAVLEEIVQGAAAGDAEFVDYFRRSLRQRKPWDALFRELLTGPWNSDDSRAAGRFLETRTKDLDRLTTDAARAFFGVDVSCARCHDHPLVDDWKQDHYYGMASFFNRTTGGKGSLGEKTEGDVTFRTVDGTQKTARLMFLSGVVASEPPPDEAKKTKFSRREQLVSLALSEKAFFSRAFVNRVWAQLFGRGLVHPVDQMHSANAPSVPGLLEWLAEDFAASGYDIPRLVAGIACCRAYRLSSRWDSEAAAPDEGDFAVFRVRLLSRRQYALSLLVATGRADFAAPAGETRVERATGVRGLKRIEQYLAAEEKAAAFQKQLDPGYDGQSSAAEALFVSNADPIQQLVKADANSFAESLAKMSDARKIAEAALAQVFTRMPVEGEVERLSSWIEQKGTDRAQACEELLWALLTSAEFRFNH